MAESADGGGPDRVERVARDRVRRSRIRVNAGGEDQPVGQRNQPRTENGRILTQT